MAISKNRVVKKRGAAAIERKRQHDGVARGAQVKGYAIVVDGGAKAIGASIRSNDTALSIN